MKLPTLEEIREKVRKGLSMLHPTITRFDNPHVYPVGLEKTLHHKKTDLIIQLRENS